MTEALAPPLPADTQGAAGNQLHDGVLGPDDLEEFPRSTYVFITHFFLKNRPFFKLILCIVTTQKTVFMASLSSYFHGQLLCYGRHLSAF